MTDPALSFATPRVAAAALFRNAGADVLLVQPNYKDTWDLPGGYVERGESPAAACRREVLEELGVDMEPRRLLAVDWAPSDGEGAKLLFLFGCEDTLPGSAIFRSTKVSDEWQWVLTVQIKALTIPRLAQCILAVIAVDPALMHYLEHDFRYFDDSDAAG